MSKELEVLIKNSKNIVDKYEEWAIGEIKNFADKNGWSLKLMSGFIEKALTPPTQEEVCKALSEHHKQEVIYDKKLKAFYTESPFKDGGYIDIARYYYTLKIVKIDLPYQLDMVELITKFYKGDIKNEKT